MIKTTLIGLLMVALGAVTVDRSVEALPQGESPLKTVIQDENIVRASNVEHTDHSWLRLEEYEDLPSSLDYSADGRRVGPVRDQGDCASGWAMAAVGLIEGQEKRNSTAKVIPLSVQNILDCDQYDSGCDGGDVGSALRAVQDEGGLNREETYPYEGKGTANCRYNKYSAYVTSMYMKAITVLTPGDEILLQKTLAKYGPVAVGVDASQPSFMGYKSGIYHDSECKSDKINHHMLLVGYGTSEDGQEYWKLKNSWSSDWGMSGYMLLARNRDNHCGIASKAIVVEIRN